MKNTNTRRGFTQQIKSRSYVRLTLHKAKQRASRFKTNLHKLYQVIVKIFLYNIPIMKMRKLLRMGMVPLLFSFIAFATACNNPRNELEKLTKLLEPISVLDDSFELESASKDKRGNKENRYGLSKPTSLEKHVFVVEFNVDNTTNRQKLANAYADYLKKNGEEVVPLKDGENLSAFYSVDRQGNAIYLFVSKFTDNGPGKVLKNEYVLQLSKQQDNQKYIQQIVNGFINAEKIDIRHIIIEKQGNITNVRSY